jgi:hypothetical protein
MSGLGLFELFPLLIGDRKMAVSKVVSGIYAALKASREADGAAVMRAKDVAKIVKIKLSAAFPGVKFSVKSDYDSVDIYWTDGPCSFEVDKIAKRYSFGGFDGSIDMAYSSKNWMLPNGDMVFAETSGTQGSMGYVPSGASDCPEPGAIIVKYGPKYVFTHRDTNPEHKAKWLKLAEERYGFEVPEGVSPWNYRVESHREWASTLAMRLETGLAKEAAGEYANV